MQKIVTEIIMTVHLLRTVPQIDVERLSYTLQEAEWMEFIRHLSSLYNPPRNGDLWRCSSLLFYGITVRKAVSEDTNPPQLPIRIQVYEESGEISQERWDKLTPRKV